MSLPDYSVTLGPEVGAIATLAGFPPDPEQQMLLDAAFAINPKTGKSIAFEVVVIAPRQNLKTGFMKQYALGQLFIRDEPLVVWSAHEFATAQDALRDMEALIEGADILRSRVKRTNRGDVAKHGAVPEIEMTNGARLIFKTRTSGGGRGLSGRKVILDEGYALQAGQVGALYPIMLAQPDPQIVVGSSACRPESAVLADMVKRGRAGGDPRMVFAEWCMPLPAEACTRGDECDHARGSVGCALDDTELIGAVHSAVRRGRILMATVIDLRRTMPPAEYGREIGGWHDEVIEDKAEQLAIDAVGWDETTGEPKSLELQGFGIDVSPDRAFTSIGAFGTGADGRGHLKHIERRRGTGWVVGRCVELAKLHGAALFAVDGKGGAEKLVEDLEDADLEVMVASGDDLADACADIVDAVNERTITHGSDEELLDAVGAAVRRFIGDGRFVFGRRASTEDITPLYGVTLAKWAAEEGGPNIW